MSYLLGRLGAQAASHQLIASEFGFLPKQETLKAQRCFAREDTQACKNGWKEKHFKQFPSTTPGQRCLRKMNLWLIHLSTPNDKGSWGKVAAIENLPQSCSGPRGRTSRESDAF